MILEVIALVVVALAMLGALLLVVHLVVGVPRELRAKHRRRR